jgi:ATP-dependent Clp protease ATP-binding subunit ClpC
LIGEQGQIEGGDILPTAELKRALKEAESEARRMGHSYVGTEHMIIGLAAEEKTIAGKVLSEAGVDVNEVRATVKKMLSPGSEEGYSDGEPDEGGRAVPAGGGSEKKSKSKALRAFGRDITELAVKGVLDPVIGREDEVDRVVQILCRRSKNNPVLAGEAGVGKTAIAEGLAQRIIQGKVPEDLLGKRVISLDLALMVAGTKYRGQFEERIKAVMDEVRKNRDVILFLDELHTLVGAGGAEGAMDASNIIKPALARGELHCVGATTLDEYRRYIEKDAALERRFQMIHVGPPTVEQSVEILRGLRSRYEEHHRVSISDEALQMAAELSDRYMPGRNLPDKAIDIIDEAGAMVKIRSSQPDGEAQELGRDLDDIRKRKEVAVKAQDYSEASRLRDMEIEILEKVRKKKQTVDSTGRKRGEVGAGEVRRVVSKWTGVPLEKMSGDEGKKLLDLESALLGKLIGQDHAVSGVAKALRRSRAELRDPRRPIGSFLFLGPSGVGKTLLAKLLSEQMFGSRDNLIQVDMSEYMEKHAVSRLVGSPPGYVGHEDGGQLTEAVRRRPYSLVLFDEVEKAHPDAINILLQVLEDGRLTDGHGRKVDFRNCLVILTSNAGIRGENKGGSLGFGQNEQDDREKIVDEAKALFRPELLNRLDDIIVFHKLKADDLGRIAALEAGELIGRLRKKGVELVIGDKAVEFLVTVGGGAGARAMRRAVERYLEDPLAEMLIRDEIPIPGKLFADRGEIALTFKPI